MILDSSLWNRMLGSGSHSLIALSMHDRFWYRCLGDATHLLLGVSVCTLGQKVGLKSHSLAGCLFACLIWDSGSHSLIALSAHWSTPLYECLGNVTHLPFCISDCTLHCDKKVGFSGYNLFLVDIVFCSLADMYNYVHERLYYSFLIVQMQLCKAENGKKKTGVLC